MCFFKINQARLITARDEICVHEKWAENTLFFLETYVFMKVSVHSFYLHQIYIPAVIQPLCTDDVQIIETN